MEIVYSPRIPRSSCVTASINALPVKRAQVLTLSIWPTIEEN
jgi:hypothetical protein